MWYKIKLSIAVLAFTLLGENMSISDEIIDKSGQIQIFVK